MSDRNAIVIAKFLEPSAATGGPLALLGLDPAQLHDVSIVAALEQRLAQVWDHAEGDSPEADEVRLALHAAAAQLLDPVMRRRALAQAMQTAQQTTTQPTQPQRKTTTTTPPSTPIPSAMAMLERDAMLTLARHGGWSPAALREVAMMGATRGLGPDDVAQALLRLSRGGNKPRKPQPTQHQHQQIPKQPQPQRQPINATHPSTTIPSTTKPTAVPTSPAASPPSTTTSPTPAILRQYEPDRNTSTGPASDVLIFAAIAITLLIGAAVAIIALTGNTGPAAPPPAQQAATIQPATTPTQQTTTSPAVQSPLPPTTADTQSRPTTPARTTSATATPDPRPEQALPQAVITDLRSAVSTLSQNPTASLAKFETAWTQLASWWPDYDLGSRRAATGAVVEFVVVASAWDDVLSRAIDIVSAPSAPLSTGRFNAAGDPREQTTSQQPLSPPPLDSRLAPNAAWSAATLARLSGERQLSATLVRRLDRIVLDRFGAWPAGVDRGIEPALAAALRRIPAAILDPARQSTSRSATAWINAAKAIEQTQPTQSQQATDPTFTTLILDGLDSVLRNKHLGPASADRWDFILQTTPHINWASEPFAQRRLIDWLRDPSIHPSGLQAVTSVITEMLVPPTQPAGAITTQGVTTNMFLSPEADSTERAQLAIEYARAWGLADAQRATESESDWRAAVTQALQDAHEAKHPDHLLASAVTISILSEAAQHLWSGDPNAAGRLVRTTNDRIAAAFTPTHTSLASSDFSTPGTDPTWAIRFIEAGRNRTVLLALLSELERRGDAPLSIIEAEVLAEAAAFGAPLDVRARAQDVTAYFANQPIVVNAVLETLPRAPRTRPFGIMIERVSSSRLPPVTDDRWPVEARRALVERLLMMRAGEGPAATIDRLVSMLAASYDQRRSISTQPATSTTIAATSSGASTTSGTGTSSGGGGNGGGAEAAALSLAIWTNEFLDKHRADARRHEPNPRAPVTIREIERRLAGRRLLAQGPIQAFAADQAAITELMAYTVSAERPGRADRVLRITRDAEHARQTSSHVFQQILAAERAMLELWLVRLGELP